jgi:diguanylate cyclase (GGDEF)-like protein
VLKANLGPKDIPCRFGGEEFVFVLPGLDAARAEGVMERIRAALAASFNGDTARFTASIGIADSTHGPDLEEVLRAADAAVYAAKQGGRDRIVLAGAPRLVQAAG